MRTHRLYADVSDFRSPFQSPNLTLTGLGRAHSYREISNFRAPYDDGYFQNNTLFGLGAPATGSGTDVEYQTQAFPEKLRLYVEAGDPMGTLRRDLASVSAQIPRLAWFGIAAGASLLGYFSYKRHKKENPKKGEKKAEA